MGKIFKGIVAIIYLLFILAMTALILFFIRYAILNYMTEIKVTLVGIILLCIVADAPVILSDEDRH